MGIKIRRIPEDFKVFELNKFNILKRGKYKLYLLKKNKIELDRKVLAQMAGSRPESFERLVQSLKT